MCSFGFGPVLIQVSILQQKAASPDFWPKPLVPARRSSYSPTSLKPKNCETAIETLNPKRFRVGGLGFRDFDSMLYVAGRSTCRAAAFGGGVRGGARYIYGERVHRAL